MRNIKESILRITAEDYRREAVGFEGRAAHGSVVGAEIRGWRSRELVGAGGRRKGAEWRGNQVEASGARRDRGGVENVGDFAIPGKIPDIWNS